MILVTGCAGFIGSHLCESLLKSGECVVGVDNMNEYYDVNQKRQNLSALKTYNNFEFVCEDVVSTDVIVRYKPVKVVHLAAMAGVRNSLNNPRHYARVNVEGHINLLEQSVQVGVKLFVYASSSSVYGTNKKVPFQETDRLENLNSPYAATKYCGEIMSQLYNKLYGLSTIGLRFFTVYGPRGRPDMAPYKFLQRISKGNLIDKYGTGETYRDYTYIDDIVGGILGAIKNPAGRTCEVYNLGNSKTVTLNEFIQTCEHVTGKSAIINQCPQQKGDVPYTYSDISKARQDLGYNPSIDLHTGLTRMYAWMKTNSFSTD